MFVLQPIIYLKHLKFYFKCKLNCFFFFHSNEISRINFNLETSEIHLKEMIFHKCLEILKPHLDSCRSLPPPNTGSYNLLSANQTIDVQIARKLFDYFSLEQKYTILKTCNQYFIGRNELELACSIDALIIELFPSNLEDMVKEVYFIYSIFN